MIRWPVDWSKSSARTSTRWGTSWRGCSNRPCDRFMSRLKSSVRACRVPIMQFASGGGAAAPGARFLQTGCRRHRADRCRSRGDRVRGRDASRAESATLSRIETMLAAAAEAGGSARGDPARAGPRRRGDRIAGRVVVRGLRAVEPGHSGTARAQLDQLEGRPGAVEREHGTGQRLYRNIVKKLFDERTEAGPHRAESIRVA